MCAGASAGWKEGAGECHWAGAKIEGQEEFEVCMAGCSDKGREGVGWGGGGG